MELVCSAADESSLGCRTTHLQHFQIVRKPGGREPFHLAYEHGVLRLVKQGDRKGIWVEDGDIRRRLAGDFLLGRACGIRSGQRLSILDATAGMGLDGLALVRAGQSVHLLEREPALWALLGNLLERLALSAPDVRLSLKDSREELSQGGEYDVVYLDPMFPPRSKSALPGKRMQYLAELLGGGEPVDVHLIDSARDAARMRVVVKGRVKDAPPVTPDWSIRGRSVRYDVYRGLARGYSTSLRAGSRNGTPD